MDYRIQLGARELPTVIALISAAVKSNRELALLSETLEGRSEPMHSRFLAQRLLLGEALTRLSVAFSVPLRPGWPGRASHPSAQLILFAHPKRPCDDP